MSDNTNNQTFDLEALKAELLADVKAESEKILTDAKKEAKKIIAEAKKGVIVTPETDEQKEKAEELVKIRLFKDRGKYSSDVTVIHNGRAWQIQRGKEVEVPRKVAQLLADSDAQRGFAADIIEGYKDEYEASKDNL